MSIWRRNGLDHRFGALAGVAFAGSAGIIPLFIWLSSNSSGHKVGPFDVGPLYTSAVCLLTLGLAVRYWSSREWHYLWRWSMKRVGGVVPEQRARHGRLAFLAERMLGVASFFCAGLGLIGWAAGVGPASWPAAVAGSAAALAVLAAMMRDMTGSIKTQFRRPHATAVPHPRERRSQP